MPETRSKVNSYRVRYCCDDCSKKPNSGCELKFTGLARPSYLPTYQHECPLCKKEYWLEHYYPIIIYEESNNDMGF